MLLKIQDFWNVTTHQLVNSYQCEKSISYSEILGILHGSRWLGWWASGSI